MARGPSTFRKQDVTRAVKATVAAGVRVSKVKITRGGDIEIEALDERLPAASAAVQNEWDGVSQ